MLLQNEHDLVVLLGAAAVILLVLSIMGGVIAALKAFQVRQFQDLLFKAERKIDTLERRMFNVLNAVPVALVETDATGKFTFANRAAHQLLGRKDNELLGLRFHSATWGITYPDGRVIPADLLPIARTLRGQTVRGFQHMLTRYGAREKILVSVTSMPVMNSVGEVIGSSAAFVELETTQGEGIDDLNGLWRGHWFEAATAPFWGLDAAGRIVDLNAAACEAFGVTREQALGGGWTQAFVADADFQAAMDYLAQVQEGGAHDLSAGLTLRAPLTGETAPMRVTAWRVRTHEGGAEGLTVMALPQAVSETPAQPESQPAAQDAEELADHRGAEAARAALGVGVWRYDPDSDAIVEDAALRRLIGRESEGGPTRIAEADQARADAAFGELMRGERDEIALDIPVAQDDGGTRWIALQGRATMTPDGQRSLYGVAYDVTRWREAPDAETAPVEAAPEAEAESEAETEALQQRVAALEADLSESRNLLALLQRRYVALAETSAPSGDDAHEARIADLQSQLDAARAELQARQAPDPAPNPANEARLNALQAALDSAQRFETVGRLTHDVALDFAQMLNVINGALEVMAKQKNSPENLRRLSEAALAAGRRGERLTRQLQAFQSEEF